MKKSMSSLRVLTAASALCTAFFVLPASAVKPSSSDKVAVFDVQAAILGTEMAKSTMKAFEGRPDIAKMIKDAEKAQKELLSMREDFDKNGSKWSAQQKEDKRKAVEFKQSDLEIIARKLNTERQATGKKLMDNLGPRLESVVKSLVESKGIGLLLDRKAAIHADPSFDITPDVTTKLNATKPANGG